LAGRAGWLAQPNLLLYAQGGAAWTQATFTFNDPTGLNVGEVSRNKSGWTVGGGVEWMFVPHWSMFVEYNFLGFGTNSSSVIACGGACILSGKSRPSERARRPELQVLGSVAGPIGHSFDQIRETPEHQMLRVFRCPARRFAETKFPPLPKINSSETSP
jgi:hypothetical protein